MASWKSVRGSSTVVVSQACRNADEIESHPNPTRCIRTPESTATRTPGIMSASPVTRTMSEHCPL